MGFILPSWNFSGFSFLENETSVRGVFKLLSPILWNCWLAWKTPLTCHKWSGSTARRTTSQPPTATKKKEKEEVEELKSSQTQSEPGRDLLLHQGAGGGRNLSRHKWCERLNAGRVGTVKNPFTTDLFPHTHTLCLCVCDPVG